MLRSCSRPLLVRALALPKSLRKLQSSMNMQLLLPRVCLPHPRLRSTESDGYDSDREPFTDVELTKDETEIPRLNLYPGADDSLLASLTSAGSFQNVFDLIQANQDCLDERHASQAIITLWDLQKILYRIGVAYGPEVLVQDYIHQVRSHEMFKVLLNKLNECHQKLTDDALVCSVLYLDKMGLDIKNDVMQNLISAASERLPHLPLTALSRFTVIFRNKGLYGAMMLAPVMPIISSRLEQCSSDVDLRLVTICLNNTHSFISSALARAYFRKVEELSDNIFDPMTMAKVMCFLTRYQWIQRSKTSQLIKKLGRKLEGNVGKLDIFDQVILHKVLELQMEPAGLMEALQSHMARVVEEETEGLPRADVLYCVVWNSVSVAQKKKLESVFQMYMKDMDIFAQYLPQLLKLIRVLKIKNKDLYKEFWDKVVVAMDSSPTITDHLAAHHYLHFLAGSMGQFRHKSFESHLKNILLKELKYDSIMSPHRFFRIASFFIACSTEGIPDIILHKLRELVSQISVSDTMALSKGVQVALQRHRNRGFQSNHVLDQITGVVQVLNDCALDHITSSESVFHLATVGKAYLNRRGTTNTLLFETLNSKIASIIQDDLLSSRTMLDLAYIYSSTSYLVKPIMDHLVSQVVDNAECLMPETLEKFLNLFYVLGYRPKCEEFLTECLRVLERHHEKLPCITILQASLALCFFQCVNESSLQSIFNVDFLDRIEEEINAQPKLKYSVKLRQLLMELNRCVCIEYPEANIPWFHEKYCQEMTCKIHVNRSVFQDEVRNILCRVAGSEKYIKDNVYSPYYHYIDFEVLVDKEGNPIPNVHSNPLAALVPSPDRSKEFPGHQKIAILLLHDDAYCANVHHLKGPYQMKQRHLEILGYKVMAVSNHLWNAMYMSEPGAKRKYVEESLFAEA